MGFEMRYLPPLTLQESDAYPGWKKKPNQGINLFSNLEKIQNLPENQANPSLQGLAPNALPGSWVLKDNRMKPNYKEGKQTYAADGLIQGILKKLNLPPGRNSIGPKIFNDPKFWEEFKTVLKLEDIPNALLRLPRVIEANVMGQSPDWDATNTYEWCEEYYQSGRRLISGLSGNGGASYVYWSDEPFAGIGFRPLVVFSSEIGSLESGSLDLWKEKVEKLRQEESQKLTAFFEKKIDVPPLPAEITPERLENWEKLGMELHYFPPETMTKDNKLKNWKKSNDFFYDQIKQGEIPASAMELPEGWFVIDGRQKPAYNNGNQMYDNDPLAEVLAELNRKGIIKQSNYDKTKKLDPKSRFGLSPADFDKPEVKRAIAEALDLELDQLSLTETIVWNVLANIHHPEWGTTNTSEWCEEKNKSGRRLVSGYSDNGGASYVYWIDGPRDNLGFRPLGRFSP